MHSFFQAFQKIAGLLWVVVFGKRKIFLHFHIGFIFENTKSIYLVFWLRKNISHLCVVTHRF